MGVDPAWLDRFAANGMTPRGPPRPAALTWIHAEPHSEAEFQRQVIELAKAIGYRVYHTHDSRRSETGFPDLCLVGRGRVLFAELKFGAGRLTAVQAGWLEAIRAAGTPAFEWRPADWPEIVKTLEG